MADIDDKIFERGLLGPIKPQISGELRKEFLIPPFTVLSAREGSWQYRKRAWLALGIEGEVGRKDVLYKSPTMDCHFYDRRKEEEEKQNRPISIEEWTDMHHKKGLADKGVSIFDPVICEVMYRWFCPSNGIVLDPFAGGSVRGIVAAMLGLKYWGWDLSEVQIAANESQASIIKPNPRPKWVVGDSRQTVTDAPQADFVFSCPPYGDLEVYSDDPADISNMEFKQFRSAYADIINKSCQRLRDNRFACFVVGDYRDKGGIYRNLPGVTVRAFEKAGLRYYNEAVLVTQVASASMRARKQFKASRKLCKTHQNVLMFVKGDPRKAAASVGDV